VTGNERVAQRRLYNQFLLGRRQRSAIDVVRALGAVQSQDYANAKWAVAQRTTGVVDADMEALFTSGAILRTHVLRPTWHFVLPEDIRWMMQLSAARVRRSMAYYDRQLGITPAETRKSHRALERALRDGQQLTRSELASVLKRAGVGVQTGQRVGHLLMNAELDAVIISGARRGKQFTYALFDDRVPAAPPCDRDEALRDLAYRYFTTRGPATLNDWAWWSGLTVVDGKRGIDANGKRLAREEIDGRVYWSGADRADAGRKRSVHLLPNYDESFVGLRDRSAFAVRLGVANVSPRVDALMGHILFVDGQIVGGWTRTLGKRVEVTLRLLVPLTAPEKRLVNEAAAGFAKFLGLPLHLAGNGA